MARGLKRVSQRRHDALAKTNWADVERLLAAYYRGQGWSVEHCGTAGSGQRFDGGIDLKLRRADEYVLVQAKHWNAYQVPHNDIHQMIGLMVNEGATGAIVVASGEFTRAATEAAGKLGHVQLVDGAALRRMLGPLPEPAATASVEEVIDTASQWIAAASGSLGRSRRGRRRGIRLSPIEQLVVGHVIGSPRAVLLTLGIKLLGLLIAGVLIFLALRQFNQAITHLSTPPRPAATVPAPPKPASLPAPESATQRPAHLPVPAADASGITVLGPRAARQVIPPGCQLIDHFSGTYTCPPPAGAQPRREPTAAEIRQSRRLADEAIDVLGDRVPEM